MQHVSLVEMAFDGIKYGLLVKAGEPSPQELSERLCLSGGNDHGQQVDLVAVMSFQPLFVYFRMELLLWTQSPHCYLHLILVLCGVRYG